MIYVSGKTLEDMMIQLRRATYPKLGLTFEEVEHKVIDWGECRSLYLKSNIHAQMRKLSEEMRELLIAVDDCDRDRTIDAIGDMIVVLTHIAKFTRLPLTNCYIHAYNEIKDRRGTMINGLFVKEEE